MKEIFTFEDFIIKNEKEHPELVNYMGFEEENNEDEDKMVDD